MSKKQIYSAMVLLIILVLVFAIKTIFIHHESKTGIICSSDLEIQTINISDVIKYAPIDMKSLISQNNAVQCVDYDLLNMEHRTICAACGCSSDSPYFWRFESEDYNIEVRQWSVSCEGNELEYRLSYEDSRDSRRLMMCDSIRRPSTLAKEICYMKARNETDNTDFCEKIQNSSFKERCIIGIFDESICEIPDFNPKEKEECKSVLFASYLK